MGYRLDEVVPWGRALFEYQRMFSLTADDLAGRILGCGDGPASFNAEATRAGHDVTSVDPLYVYGKDAIGRRIDDVFDTVMTQTIDNADEFVWGSPIENPADLAATRAKAMNDFLGDYPAGLTEGRYVAGSLPKLAYGDSAFDLALCSHYLFLYSEQVSVGEHVASIEEMRRVAPEARIFPLQELGSRTSRHLGAVLRCLESNDHVVEIRPVDYEFQKGGDHMLVVT